MQLFFSLDAPLILSRKRVVVTITDMNGLSTAGKVRKNSFQEKANIGGSRIMSSVHI